MNFEPDGGRDCWLVSFALGLQRHGAAAERFSEYFRITRFALDTGHFAAVLAHDDRRRTGLADGNSDLVRGGCLRIR